MSYFLSVECSSAQGSLALSKISDKLDCLFFKKWMHKKGSKSSHSDKLPLSMDQALKKGGIKFSDLSFLSVGIGPGRWTGVRAGVQAIRSMAFCLKLPIYPVNSLRVCAEALLLQTQPVLVAFNGFKGHVYFAKFNSLQDQDGRAHLLPFPDWLQQMEGLAPQKGEKKRFCISDLKDFFPLPQNLTKAFLFKNLYPSALHLSQIIFRQKNMRQAKSWSQLQAFYLRSPVDLT